VIVKKNVSRSPVGTERALRGKSLRERLRGTKLHNYIFFSDPVGVNSGPRNVERGHVKHPKSVHLDQSLATPPPAIVVLFEIQRHLFFFGKRCPLFLAWGVDNELATFWI
jgi:hypothetical protein